MKDNYDFSKGVKNPYTDKLKDGYAVNISYDFAQNEEDDEIIDKSSEDN